MQKKNVTGAMHIAQALKEKIQEFDANLSTKESGVVRDTADGIATISGLSHVGSMEMVRFESGVEGVVLNLATDHVGVIILGDANTVKAGDSVTPLGTVLSIPTSKSMIGRVVNPLGKQVDGKGEIKDAKLQPIEKIAPGVMTREPVNVPLMTGIKAIDSMIPVGRGQRELIIGDRQTGKTAIAIDTIINQKGKGVTCVYVAIGQKESKVAKLVARLEEAGAMDYTVVVLAGASDPASFQFIAPYAGVAIAEMVMSHGEDALVVYDDLSKHAVAYREVSLLLRRPPGREAYPGDVFYLHSRLLERACRLNEENGGGSITALPIIETQAGDVSAYIPTNVISITDGQIYLESDLFYKGVRPAVNVGLSVSRVGGSAQTKAMKKVAGQLRLDLAQYRELEAFAQFATDLDPETRKQIDRGRRTVEILKQDQYQPLAMEHQVPVIYAVTKGYLDDVAVEDVKEWEKGFLAHLETHGKKLLEALRDTQKLDDNVEALMKEAITSWNTAFLKQK